MQINEQSCAPRIADSAQLLRQQAVIGLVNFINAPFQFGVRQTASPYFAVTWQAPRNQPQPAASAVIGRMAGDPGAQRTGKPRAFDHIPVNIRFSPIKIEHRARRMCDQQGCENLASNCYTQLIHMAIFKAQLAQIRRTHSRQQIRAIGPATVRHRDQHRQG